MVGLARRLEARPGPAGLAAASNRSGCLCVALLVFRAPEGPAAREARRPHFVRRRASKPARALRTLRRPPHRRCLWFWYARPGPAAAHGGCSQAQVLSLAYGSARQAARSSETAIAFACACMRGIETAITFAGEKRAFMVQFPGAKVSLVSMVAVRGRALVLRVSKSCVGVHCTRLFSPCLAKSAREREKVRPACSKEPKICVLWRAGRVFSRKCRRWENWGWQRGGIP